MGVRLSCAAEGPLSFISTHDITNKELPLLCADNASEHFTIWIEPIIWTMYVNSDRHQEVTFTTCSRIISVLCFVLMLSACCQHNGSL